MDYRDRVVVVTGASSGIGYVTAEAFARRGAVVVAVARREAQLAELIEACRELSPRSTYFAGDLGDRTFAEHVVDRAHADFGRLDILVNNAGISKHKEIYHVAVEEVERVLTVNFLSCVWTTFAAIPYMLRRREGWIVNVSSFASKVSPPREAIYAASKAAMNGFTEGLWNDLEGSGIHAGLVVPGAIDTEIWAKEEEPHAYEGKLAPPEVITKAIFEVIEKRVHERVAPRWNLSLMAARCLRLVAPSLLRFGMQRFEPVGPEVVARARERSERGQRLGDLAER